MRIRSIRIAPVARILAIAYAAFGLIMWLQFAFGSVAELTLPFGMVAPVFHLNVNFHLPRSSGVLYNVFLCIACVLSYSMTGWITGAVGFLLFNLIAKRTGGIEATYFSFADESATAQPQTPGLDSTS